MLGSHTSPGLIEDILLPAYWSPRTTFGTNFQERITPVSDRWKLASRDYRQRILRFLIAHDRRLSRLIPESVLESGILHELSWIDVVF